MNICQGIMDNCVNFMDSYGEICVHCNCCGRINPDTKHEHRIVHYSRQLSEFSQKLLHTEEYDDFQIKNIKNSIGSFIRDIEKAYADMMKKGGD